MRSKKRAAGRQKLSHQLTAIAWIETFVRRSLSSPAIAPKNNTIPLKRLVSHTTILLTINFSTAWVRNWCLKRRSFGRKCTWCKILLLGGSWFTWFGVKCLINYYNICDRYFSFLRQVLVINEIVSYVELNFQIARVIVMNVKIKRMYHDLWLVLTGVLRKLHMIDSMATW